MNGTTSIKASNQIYRIGSWAIFLSCVALANSEDWPMRGHDNFRNPVSLEKNPPLDWKIPPLRQGKGSARASKNILWSAELGSCSWGDPVIADGLVWVGTNNETPRDPAARQDATALLCFREKDGKFLYQYLSNRMKEGKRFDWEFSPLASSPLVEGDRLWFCNNRAEVVCLDIGALHSGTGEPRVIWKLDMIHDLGVVPHTTMIGTNQTHCSVASYGDFIYVNTTNGWWYHGVPAPNAPSLVCLRKDDGKVVWKDHSPGKDIRSVQQTNPLVVDLDGQVQAIMGQGDGWLRSFDALTGQLLWKFDINFKKTPRSSSGYVSEDDRTLSYFAATPVYYNHRIYAAAGREAELARGLGRLVCIDGSKLGDISSELEDGPGKGKPNPNSGLLWEYLGQGMEMMHLTFSSMAIHNRLLIAPDYEGLVHCLDAYTGQHYWTQDAGGLIYNSPLIVDNKVYLATEEGEDFILDLSPEKKPFIKHDDLDSPSFSSPVYANGVLYLMTHTHLYAIKEAINP